jgi:ribosomal-protein-alanine acetyltransferase
MSPNHLKIEPLRLEELDAACALEREAGLSTIGIEGFSKRLHHSQFVLLGAFLQRETELPRTQRLVGLLSGWVIEDEVEIDNLVVALAHREKGVGKQILTAALQYAWHRGGRRVFLEVRESNLPALRLYRSIGFAVIGRRRSYYANPLEDALVLALELKDAALERAGIDPGS